MTAANTLEQINNQIKQLQNQAQIAHEPGEEPDQPGLQRIERTARGLSATNRLIRQAQGLAFNVQQMETQFQQLHPSPSSASVSSAQMVLDARKRWTNSREALRTATQVQSQAVQNFASDESTLTDLLNRSQSAVGALQATQATNQLLALQARQSMQAQQLQITQDRAAALEQARQVAVQERAREVRRRFMGRARRTRPTR